MGWFQDKFGLSVGEFFVGKEDPAPDFENVVKVVLSTFAVFVGFTINEYLKKITIGDFAHWQFWSFIALAALLLRYIIGSSVHLNFVYVQKIPAANPTRSRSRSVVLLFKDLCFLVIFGMIAVNITKANTLDDFVNRTLLFVLAGLAWSILDLIRCRLARADWWNDSNEKPGKMVGLWILLDFVLLGIVYGINWYFGDELTRAAMIAILYVIFLLLNLLAIVRGVQFA
jgi:hypothetical protein